MSNVLNSASKIVFIIMAGAIVIGLFTGHVDQKDFMMLGIMVFQYYFQKNAQNTNTTIASTSSNTNTE